MADAYIVDAVRTAGGKRGGRLADVLGDAAVDEPETMVGLPHVADFGEDPFADPLDR